MNKKGLNLITTNILAIFLIIISITLIFISTSFISYSSSAEEKVDASLENGIGYSSNLQTDNEQNLRLWLIGNLILKILVGIAIVIIAVAILIKVLNRKKK